MTTYVILHNLRSAQNVGSIFRTADAAGVSKVFLCGYTPSPVDRFGRVQPQIEKVALGATASVDWEACEDTAACVRTLSKEGVTVVAVEQAVHAHDYRSYQYPEHVAFLFGNEIHGVSPELMAAAGQTVSIPMRGTKESLNVAVAAGIILFSTR